MSTFIQFELKYLIRLKHHFKKGEKGYGLEPSIPILDYFDTSFLTISSISYAFTRLCTLSFDPTSSCHHALLPLQTESPMVILISFITFILAKDQILSMLHLNWMFPTISHIQDLCNMLCAMNKLSFIDGSILVPDLVDLNRCAWE